MVIIAIGEISPFRNKLIPFGNSSEFVWFNWEKLIILQFLCTYLNCNEFDIKPSLNIFLLFSHSSCYNIYNQICYFKLSYSLADIFLYATNHSIKKYTTIVITFEQSLWFCYRMLLVILLSNKVDPCHDGLHVKWQKIRSLALLTLPLY